MGRGDRPCLQALQPRAGAGLSKVAGKLFRIGHLGDLNELMLLGAIGGAEMAMMDAGAKPRAAAEPPRAKLLAQDPPAGTAA